MCGLNGIFAYAQSAAPVDPAELLRTREHMVKRGPDGAGIWMSPDQRLGLAHRRLAIIDLSPNGAQPMATADGRYQIVFNGEIYNYRELQAELKQQGAVFQSQSDTEVLLHLYAQHGEGMCQRLRGMFAFAIWDTQAQTLFLARDPFGIKPLYVHDDSQTLRFASQVKALLAGGAVPNEFSDEGELGYWIWGHVPEPHTLYQNILAVPPGSWIKQGRNGPRTSASFETVEELLSGDEGTPFTNLHDALLDSVRHHLIADVPVGIFLSAGIDSAVITALAAECGSALHTITLGFEEFRSTPNDETVLAEKLAKEYGTKHHTVWVTKADFELAFDSFIEVMDQPSIDGLNTWLICRAAAQLGLKVVLSGLGGDEFFGGYPSFRQVPRMHRVARPFSATPGLARIVRQVARPILRSLASEKLAGLLEYGHTWEGAYTLRRAVRMPWEARAFGTALPEPATQRLRNNHAVVSHLEATRYMRNQLLRDSDWASMAHSIELRVPLVDTLLTSHIAHQRRAGYTYSKQDLAAAARPPLPEEVTRRPKTGFLVPQYEWTGHIAAGRTGSRESLHDWQALVHRIYTGQPPRKRKKVLLLTTDAYGGHGGIALYNRDVVDALAEMPEVTNITVLPRVVKWKAEGIPSKAIQNTAALGGKWNYITTALKAAREPYDLVICGHINLLPLAVLMNWRLRAPLVLIVYGIDVWAKPYITAKYWVNAVDAVWSISTITRNRMIAWARNSKIPYTILPNAIHLNRYGMAPRRTDLIVKYKLEGSRVMMTLARYPGEERYKGVDEVLETMPSLLLKVPNLKYLVAGDGNDVPRLVEKTRRLGLENEVIFTGLLNETEKADHYRLADVFVMPGKGEGFGFVFLEALACGVPAVGSQLDGSREALREGELGELADPNDISTVHDCILRALDKPLGVLPGLAWFAWPEFKSRLSNAARTSRQTTPRR